MPNVNPPLDDLRELLELMIKAGRRCAHDLAHAADDANTPLHRSFYKQRADIWRAVFYADGGPKDYQNSLNVRIRTLENEISRLQILCRKNNIDPTDPDSIPF